MARPLKVAEWKGKSVEAVTDAVGKVIDVSRSAVDQVDRKAHRRPWLFVGAAAAFSSFLGFFIGRKSKKKF